MDERHNQLSEADQRVVAMAEAEIRRALSAEPSSEFQAKVRARIAAQPRRTFGWRLGFQVAIAASIVVAVAAVAMFELRPAKPDVAPLTATATQPSLPQADRASVASQPPHLVPPVPAMRPSSVHRVTAAVPARDDEVLIDPAQKTAVRRLFAMARRAHPDKVEMPADPVVTEPDGSLSVPIVVVAPLDVPSLPVGAPERIGSR
jgi:hypothetical protein